jgi:hypothetical protein
MVAGSGAVSWAPTEFSVPTGQIEAQPGSLSGGTAFTDSWFNSWRDRALI